MTRHLPYCIPVLQEEVKVAAESDIGPCLDWTPIPAYAKSVRFIALLSSRIFFDLPLSRDESWLKICTNFTYDAYFASEKLRTYSWLTRPFASLYIPHLRVVKSHQALLTNLIKPIVEDRLRCMKDPKWERSEDMIQWVMENAKSHHKEMDVLHQVQIHLLLTWAGIHTTTTLVSSFFSAKGIHILKHYST